MVACAPRSRIVERFPARSTVLAEHPAPAGGAVARFVVVSRGVRHERVRDGFGCTAGEVPGLDVIRAQSGPRWEAHVFLQVAGRPLPTEEPDGLRLANARGGSTGMRTREEAERGAADGEVQACWSADGSRLAFRMFHPAAMGHTAWTRVAWTPAPQVFRYVGPAADCAAALTQPEQL
jgi:hypothetical protein